MQMLLVTTQVKTVLPWLTASTLLLTGCNGTLLQSALADSSYASGLPSVINENWLTECSSCHIGYLPSMLPASSWSAMMKNLDNHFGEDASLDPPLQLEIQTYLKANASPVAVNGATSPLLRITDADWFRDEHQEELPTTIWRRTDVKSPSNCSACHRLAGQGDYDEDNIDVPG